jgi:ribonucleotide reductase beta subunit family protein with ferritin-like domain
MKHLPNLPPDQVHFLSVVLGFFATSNKIVANNLSQNFMTDLTSLEVQFFYDFQLMMENIHNVIYSLLIDTYIKDKKKQNDIYTAIETIITIGTKAKWAERWCNSQHSSFDKICMMTTRLACNRAIESSYWRMDNDSDVGLLMGYVLYRLPVELEFMDLDTFPR